jgi:hypothetical protein
MQRGRYAGELIIERGAQPIDHGDDLNRNAGGNEALFDRGGAMLIFQKRNKLRYSAYSMTVATALE